MNGREASGTRKHLPSTAALPRENIRYSTLEKQPAGWVKVFHRLSMGKQGTLELCYTPDMHVLKRESAKAWLSCYEGWSDSLEALAVELMDDFRNEIIPRWVRLTLQHDKSFRIEVEDRQPNWNPQRSGRFSDALS